MSAANPKTVWILGAGFSRSLGGPLLTDILSPASQARVNSTYPRSEEKWSKLHAPLPGTLRGVFANGEARRRDGVAYWSDAEDFLDQLDADVRTNRPERMRFIVEQLGYGDPKWTGEQLEAFRDAARRLLAAECCAFLERVNMEEERWLPYRSWATIVGARRSDVVLTFNYDRVLELLGFDIVPPDPSDDEAKAPRPFVRVYKLHGSVDWRRDTESGEPARFGRTKDPTFALTCPDSEIGLATPGPSKRLATEELKGIWTPALEHLRQADAIVFVGYRFPPSDAESRQKLLEAIEGVARDEPEHHLSLHIVLGPNRADPNVVRLGGLLREMMGRAGRGEFRVEAMSGRTFSLVTHPLFAEDFFTVFSPDRIHRREEFPNREPG